jgi:hypothetical protein
MKITSGSHLGVVRSWIQRKFVRGNDVIWGSDERLQGDISVSEYEFLAQEIRDVSLREFKEKLNWIKRVSLRQKENFEKKDIDAAAWDSLMLISDIGKIVDELEAQDDSSNPKK